jgi:hypothetical protein
MHTDCAELGNLLSHGNQLQHTTKGLRVSGSDSGNSKSSHLTLKRSIKGSNNDSLALVGHLLAELREIRELCGQHNRTTLSNELALVNPNDIIVHRRVLELVQDGARLCGRDLPEEESDG